MVVKGCRKMPKKIPIQQKRDWLVEYENGKSKNDIAKDANRDIRTINEALEDARRDRDARFARAELMKESLYKHQDLLRNGLNNIVRSLELPTNDCAPLSWHECEKSIFKRTYNLRELTGVHGISFKKGRPSVSSMLTDDLLRQHFRNDKTWKLLVQWEKVYLEHINDRLTLQEKLVSLIERKTGYHLVDREKDESSFVYSYTTGPILYEAALESVLKIGSKYNLEADVKVDPNLGEVRFRHSSLVKDPGDIESCRDNIIMAYKELLESPAIKNVADTYNNLSESGAKARQAVEEINLLGYIPGSCNVCRRLGM